MWTRQQWLMFLGVMAGMISIIPLMVWGGSGDWRRSLTALREYLSIMGALVGVVGFVALAVWIAEVTNR